MIERLLRGFFELLVLLIVVAFVSGLVIGILREGASAVGSLAERAAPRILGSVVVTLLTGLLVIGVVVRVQRLLSGGSGRAGRERATQARQTRLAARRPADDVPAIPHGNAPPEDSDPPINTGPE